ncbi:LysR substrate-binding domain-containing protein [soil metagenome]
MQDLEIDLLRAFLFVQQSGGFSSAAELLNRTQPAISLQIKRLEKRVGGPLFERNRSGPPSLTPLGSMLVGYANQILALHDEAIARMAKPVIRSRVRLGILEELGHTRLPLVLRSFAGVFQGTSPHVQVSLSNQLVTGMLQGRLDFAVVSGEAGFAQGVTLWREPLVWVGSSAVPIRLKPPLPLVLLPEPCFYRRAAVEALTAAGLRWTQAGVSSTMTGVRATVVAGLGISVMGRSEVSEGLRIVNNDFALPRLPAAEIMLYFRSPDMGETARLLAGHISRGVT